jgi:hypothetical protein
MSASLPFEIVQKYKGNCLIFFETGTSEGDSSQTALEAGFDDVRTVELDRDTYNRVQKRFFSEPKVHSYLGLSHETLKGVIPFLDKPTLFFLDAHPDCHHDLTPVLYELENIKAFKYPCVIIIDDMRLMGKEKWKDITIPVLIDKLNEINPQFTIVFEENGHAPGDLLVAYIPGG